MPFCALCHCPVTAAKKIFELIDPVQLFELSRLSKKLESKIREAGVKCQKHLVSFTKYPAFCLDFGPDKQLEFVFNFPFPKKVKIRYDEFEELSFCYAAVSESKIIVCAVDSPLYSSLYRFYDHVADIFRTSVIGQLDIDVDKIKNLIGLLGIPELKNCQTLQLIGNEMEEEDAKYIQENCQIHETLILNGNAGRRDQHFKLFEVKNLIIRNNDWINFNDLILMQCENIFIENEIITDSDLVKFVEMWKNGETNIRLKTLQCRFIGEPMFPEYTPISNIIQQTLPPTSIEVNDDDSEDSDSADEEFQEQIRRANQLKVEEKKHEELRVRHDIHLKALERSHPWIKLERKMMDFENHSRTFIRGEANYSSLIKEPDLIDLDSLYRDVEKFDGTFASIRVHHNSFKMMVWHIYELPPSNCS